MKAAITKEPNAPFEVVTDVEKPKPGPDQILVRSIAAAINPVDPLMIAGALPVSFPMVLGCDVSGVVVEAGTEAESSFKVGDRVCGCTRLGETGYGAFQEYFLIDARLAIPLTTKLSFEQGATVGVGSETAALGLFNGLHIKLPDPKALPEAKDEWVVILGGAGSVGQYAVQLAKLSGYKVIATCSVDTASLVQNCGADATIDYRKPEDDQLQELRNITNGNFSRVFDTVAQSAATGLRALREISTSAESNKFLATTNSWAPFEDSSISIYKIQLGLIGKPTPVLVATQYPTLNDDLSAYIAVFAQLLEDGKLVPNPLEIVNKVGFEGVADALALKQKGTSGGAKVVVKLQEE